MSGLSIPQRHLSGLKALIGLGSLALDELATSLTSEAAYRQTELASRLERSGMPPGESQSASSALLSLYSVQQALGSTPQELVDDLLVALEQQTGIATARELAGPLVRILSVPAMSLQAKAHNLVRADARNYCTAGIVTDLRAVFSDEPGNEPRGFALIHFLRVQFHGPDGELDTFHVALDSSDLEDLEDKVQRARADAAALETHIRATGATMFNDPRE